MKVYISAAKTIQQLKEQDAPDMDESIFEELVRLDPTSKYDEGKGGKYTPWVIRQYKKGNIDLDAEGEDSVVNSLVDSLGLFTKDFKHFSKRDINQYKTVQEFLDESRRVGNRELTPKELEKLHGKQAHLAGDNDKQCLVEDGDWQVWTPKTYAGSIALARMGGGKQAEWCTAWTRSDSYYRSYTARGPLYIFINKNNTGEKYQSHFGNDGRISWFYDIDDHERGQQAFTEFCAKHPKIQQFFKLENKDGIQTMAGNVIGYDPNATKIVIPEGGSLLSGKRLPSSLETVVLPDTMTSLPSSVFAGLASLVNVRLPKSLTEIPSDTFKNCTSLSHIDIPDSVTVYGSNAFSGCTSLKTINHSNSLQEVKDYCFKDCTSLEDDLPNTVTKLGKDVFAGADLAEFTMPESLMEISPSSFAGCNIKQFNINNVKTIKANAFKESGVNSIDLRNVNHIGSNAFRGCNKLTTFDFNPEGVSIGPYAFADSKAKPSKPITLYPSTTIDIGTFDNCPNMTIQWEKDDEPYPFFNIGLLICDEKKCPELVRENKGTVRIQTTQGNEYPVT